jgi:hypothetical protein
LIAVTQQLRSGARRVLVIAVALAVISIAHEGDAHAGRVHDLSRTLNTSKYDKARIAAAVSLGRLKDQRALRPLVRALMRDANHIVRAIAAQALGYLGNRDALPALKRATRDKHKLVRKRATESIARIRNHITTRAPSRSKRRRAGFGNRPGRLSNRPNLYVAVRSTSDDSKTHSSRKARKARAKRMRRLLLSELNAAPRVTLRGSEARGLSRFNIDASITKFRRSVNGPYVEVECQIRVAISNDRGKMLSFLTGGAKVQVPRRTFRSKYLPALRLEALENAVKGINQDVINHLRRTGT